MAFTTDLITAIDAYNTTAYDADDGAWSADNFACMTNGTLTEDCDEIKEGTISLKVVIGVDISLVNTLSVRFYLNTMKTSGVQALLPYTDSNSVSNTYEVTQTYDTGGQWYTHACTANFLGEVGDLGDTFAVRLSSGSGGTSGSAKSKIGEVEIDMDWDGPEINGITRDKTGTILGSCDCYLLKYVSSSVWTFEDHVVSNATTGAYQFIVPSTSQAYVVAFFKPGTNDVMDITERVYGVTP